MLMKHLDLFSGIGGFALGAYWVWGKDHHIHSFVEIEPFCQKVLKKHWPNVPIHNDIRSYEHDGTTIDLLTGGYPCQAFSTAAHGQNTVEDLSPLMFHVVEKVQPKFIIAENVASGTIDGFAKKLRSIGYGTSVCCVNALKYGADHKRNRWFCVAYPNNQGEFLCGFHAKVEKLQGIQGSPWKYENYAKILRISNGVSHRVDRLKALGNAIVPQVVVPIMQAIKQIEEKTKKFNT
jgi:DNA (cytosine-5)-methyltransferase 1